MEDSWNLQRFVNTQKTEYEIAKEELLRGRKESHWVWYTFPQVKGLGFSYMSEYYGISGLEEAEAYLDDEFLRKHLVELCEIVMSYETNDLESVLGYIDAVKLRSSMTLFSMCRNADAIFNKVLEKYFGGEKDELTLEILNKESAQ